jgi:hypothetical protein
MSGWLELFDQVAKSGTASGGGLILLSSRFRDVTLDRRATYPVLSRLMRTFAYTRKRGFPADDKFAAWRNRRTYGIHLAVLEGYVCQHPLTFAEYLVDNAIWRHLYPAFSSYVRQLFQVNSSRSLGPLGGVFEADILKAAETAKGIEDVAEGLQASEGSLGGAVRLRRALVDWRNLAVPPTPETHAFEVCYPAGDDAELQEYVESAVQALFQEFPIPVHPYCESQGALSERLRRVRGESIVCVRSKMLHRFREWSLKAHRTWMRPSDPVTVRAQALLQAIGGTVLQCEPTNLRGAAADVEYWLRFLSPFPHVDPEVSGDEREKLCPGVERIQFIHLMPLAPELTC